MTLIILRNIKSSRYYLEIKNSINKIYIHLSVINIISEINTHVHAIYHMVKM